MEINVLRICVCFLFCKVWRSTQTTYFVAFAAPLAILVDDSTSRTHTQTIRSTCELCVATSSS